MNCVICNTKEFKTYPTRDDYKYCPSCETIYKKENTSDIFEIYSNIDEDKMITI